MLIHFLKNVTCQDLTKNIIFKINQMFFSTRLINIYISKITKLPFNIIYKKIFNFIHQFFII